MTTYTTTLSERYARGSGFGLSLVRNDKGETATWSLLLVNEEGEPQASLAQHTDFEKAYQDFFARDILTEAESLLI